MGLAALLLNRGYLNGYSYCGSKALTNLLVDSIAIQDLLSLTEASDLAQQLGGLVESLPLKIGAINMIDIIVCGKINLKISGIQCRKIQKPFTNKGTHDFSSYEAIQFCDVRILNNYMIHHQILPVENIFNIVKWISC